MRLATLSLRRALVTPLQPYLTRPARLTTLSLVRARFVVPSPVRSCIALTIAGSAAVLAAPTLCDAPKSECITPKQQSQAGQSGSLLKDGRPDMGLIRKLLWRFVELCFCLTPVVACYLLHRTPWLGSLLIPRERLLELLVRCLASCGPVGIKVREQRA